MGGDARRDCAVGETVLTINGCETIGGVYGDPVVGGLTPSAAAGHRRRSPVESLPGSSAVLGPTAASDRAA